MDIQIKKRKRIVGVVVVLLLIFVIYGFCNWFSFSGNNLEDLGVIYINFDDGLLSQYAYAFPEMKKYGYNATLFIMANKTGLFEGRELMTFDNAREMENSGWEIGSHGLDHEFIDELNSYEQIVESKNILVSEGFMISSFACAGGCNESVENLRVIGNEYYSTVRSLDWGENDLYNYNSKRLSSKWVNNIDTSERVCDWIRYARDNKKLFVLLFHGISEEERPFHSYDMSLDNFKKILVCINESGMEVKTLRSLKE